MKLTYRYTERVSAGTLITTPEHMSISYDEFMDNLPRVFGYEDYKEEQEVYVRGSREIINYFEDFENIEIIWGMNHIQILSKTYKKSWIPFFSKWVARELITLSFGHVYQGGHFYTDKYHPAAWYMCYPCLGVEYGQGTMATVSGFDKVLEGYFYDNVYDKDKKTIDDIIYILRHSFRPNSVDFILGT